MITSKNKKKLLFIPAFFAFSHYAHSTSIINPDLIVLDKLGEDICRLGFRPLDKFEAEANKQVLLKKMGIWQIAGLKDNWVIMGSGYQGEIKQEDNDYTFCYQKDTNKKKLNASSFFNDALSVKYYQANGDTVIFDSEKAYDSFTSGGLKDGVYLVDKGHSWVRSEEDFIEKGYATPGNSVSIETSKITYSSHSTKATLGSGIKTQIVEAMIKQSYGLEWRNSDTTRVNYKFNAALDKQLYVRVYSTFQRFETIEIKNSQVISNTTSYVPSGSFGKTLSYETGEIVNEYNFLEHHGERKVTDASLYSQQANSIDSSIRYLDLDNEKNIDDEKNEEQTKIVKSSALPLSIEDILAVQEIDEEGYVIDPYVDIEYFQTFVEPNSKTSLKDGFYAVDLGDHWIRGDDEGVIYTMVIPENSIGSYAKSATAYFGHQVDTKLTAKITIDMIQIVMEGAYGYKWGESFSKKVNVSVESKNKQNSYAKIYSVNHRIDLIEVRNKKIVARSSTYKPNSFIAKDFKYLTNQSLDQRETYNKTSLNLLGASEAESGGLIQYSPYNVTHDIGLLDNLTPKGTAFTQLSTRLKTYDIMVKFSVPETAYYDIGYFTELMAYAGDIAYKAYGWNADYELWELNPKNNAIGLLKNIKQLGEKEIITHRYWLHPNDFNYVTGKNRGNLSTGQLFEKGKDYALVLRKFSYSRDARFKINLALEKKQSVGESDYKYIDFETNGGSYVESQKVPKGSTIFKTPHTEKENYFLEGWYLEPSFINKFNFGTDMIIKDNNTSQTFYAKWMENLDDKDIVDPVIPPSPSGVGKPILDVTDTDPSQPSFVYYTGDWQIETDNITADNQTLARSNRHNDSMNFVFNATGGHIELYGRKDIGHGDIAIYINGHYVTTISTNNQYGASNKALLYKSPELAQGQNELQLVITSHDRDVEIDFAKIVK